MLYVGITEDHKESATMFGNMVGAQVISQLMASSSSMEGAANNLSEQSTSFPDSKSDNSHHQDPNNSTGQEAGEIDSTIPSTENVETTKENITVGELMKSYEVCISSLRKTQSYRRTNSLKAISPANFSKETRLQVPQMVLQQIISLNSLDVELYKYAQSIFAKQHKHFMRKLDTTDMQESIFDIAYDNPLWKVVSLAISLVCLLLLIFLIVNAKRRTSKLKI